MHIYVLILFWSFFFFSSVTTYMKDERDIIYSISHKSLEPDTDKN